MKKKTTKITELVIDEENEALAIDAISLVTSPALEVDFVFFGKEKNNLTFAKVDEEKRELIAPALIPNKQIYRYDANSDSDYYVYFSKDTVKNAAYSYLKHNNHHKATYQHEQRVSGVLTVESWIKEGDSDKSKLYGFDLADGTWFVKMKIENDDLWQKIREGELKGLSIEGYFIDRLEKMNKTFTDEEIQTAYKELQAEGKIQKVDLASDADKILKELNLIDKDLDSQERKIDKPYNALRSVLIDFKELLNESLTDVKDLETKLKTFVGKVKALGIEPKTVKIIGQIEVKIKAMKFYIKKSKAVKWKID